MDATDIMALRALLSDAQAEIARLKRNYWRAKPEAVEHVAALLDNFKLSGPLSEYPNAGSMIRAQQAEVERLREALEFYADPETYFAILIVPDRPAGAFADDFDGVCLDDYDDIPRPGARARRALHPEEPKR